MIVAFTSTAFNNFVANYIKSSGDSTFNPYLQFLFFALYVLPSLPCAIAHRFIVSELVYRRSALQDLSCTSFSG
jgi:chitin synthase